MSWRLKRVFVNLSYRLRIARFQRAMAMKPSTTVTVAIAIMFAIFILAGGVYDILEKPLALLPRPGAQQGWTFLFAGNVHMQTLNESILAAMLYFLGVVGLYLLLRSTRLAYYPRQAYLLLIIGLVITALSVYYTTNMLQQKLTSS